MKQSDKFKEFLKGFYKQHDIKEIYIAGPGSPALWDVDEDEDEDEDVYEYGAIVIDFEDGTRFLL